MYKLSTRFFLAVAIVCLSLLATGCSSLVKQEQSVISGFYTLDSHTTIGQTLLGRYDGLQGVSIYLQPENAGPGIIHLFVQTSPDTNQSLAQAFISSKDVSRPGYYAFQFSPIEHTTLQDLFIQVSYTGDGSVQLGAAGGTAYLNGALYQNSIAQNAQMAFFLDYSALIAALGLFKEGLWWALYLLMAVFLFVLPGWALLSGLWSSWNKLHWTERLGLAAGASLPLYPAFMLWMSLLGIRLGALYAWLPPVAGGAFLLWKNMRAFKSRPHQKRQARNFISSGSFTWADLAFLVLVGLVILVRFWEVRSLEIPMWGDSYQHTVIAQLLVDNKGLFSSWQPYAEAQTFSYHFGFHNLAAVFHWLSGLTLPQSTLWTGQILNILAVISLAPLANRLGRNRWAGAATILLAGLLFQMPNFYTNWGRYTQLAGQVILATVVWLLWSYFEDKSHSWRALAALWLILSGLALTHYRVIIMAGLFFLAYWLINARRSNLRDLTQKTFLVGVGAFFIFLPWLLRAFSSNLVRWLTNMLGIQTQK